MQKIFVALILLIGTVLFALSETKTIKNYTINVPEGWTIVDNNPNLEFILMSPEEENDNFKENCNLVSEKLPYKLTVKKYIEKSIPGIKNAASSFKLIKKTDKTILYDAVFQNISVRQIQFYFIKGLKGYVFTCSSTPKDFKRYDKIFMGIGPSLQIND